MKQPGRRFPPLTLLLVGTFGVLVLAASVSSQPAPFAAPRVQVRFTNPVGMKVWFQGADGRFEKQPRLEVPGRINLRAGSVYRLKLGDIPNRPGLNLYPTLAIGHLNPETARLVAHQAVPVELTDEDLDRVAEGQFVTRVVYLGGEGTGDPLRAARQRGTVLATLRIGNIDLESQR